MLVCFSVLFKPWKLSSGCAGWLPFTEKGRWSRSRGQTWLKAMELERDPGYGALGSCPSIRHGFMVSPWVLTGASPDGWRFCCSCKFGFLLFATETPTVWEKWCSPCHGWKWPQRLQEKLVNNTSLLLSSMQETSVPCLLILSPIWGCQ